MTFVSEDFFFPAKKFKKLDLEIIIPLITFAIFWIKLDESHHVKEDITQFSVITSDSLDSPSNFRKIGFSASCILGTYLTYLLTTYNHLDFILYPLFVIRMSSREYFVLPCHKDVFFPTMSKSRQAKRRFFRFFVG